MTREEDYMAPTEHAVNHAKPLTTEAEPSALAGLLARVGAATGADRELDAALWRSVVYERETTLRVSQSDPAQEWRVLVDDAGQPITKIEAGVWRWQENEHPFKEGDWIFDGADGRHYWYGKISPVTASLDAALALVERALPGANCYGFDKSPGRIDAYVSRNNVPSGHWLHEASGATPALAVLTALLRALSPPSKIAGEG